MTRGGRGPGGAGQQEQNVRDSLWRGVGDRGSGSDGAVCFTGRWWGWAADRGGHKVSSRRKVNSVAYNIRVE